MSEINIDELDLEYYEIAAQPYLNCVFSAGFVRGHPIDTMYIKFDRPPEEPTIIVLRPDEMAALAWCITSTTWSHLMNLQYASHDKEHE